jgi:hypothetical protein
MKAAAQQHGAAEAGSEGGGGGSSSARTITLFANGFRVDDGGRQDTPF